MREFWAFVPISFKFSSQTTVSIKKFYEQQRQEVRIDFIPSNFKHCIILNFYLCFPLKLALDIDDEAADSNRYLDSMVG